MLNTSYNQQPATPGGSSSFESHVSAEFFHVPAPITEPQPRVFEELDKSNPRNVSQRAQAFGSSLTNDRAQLARLIAAGDFDYAA